MKNGKESFCCYFFYKKGDKNALEYAQIPMIQHIVSHFNKVEVIENLVDIEYYRRVQFVHGGTRSRAECVRSAHSCK